MSDSLNIPPVLVFAVGNESRGDDALGPLLLRELEAWLKASGHSGGVELLEEFQLQVEHALDMQDRQLVLFIDAGMATPQPFAFYRVQASDTPVLYSHALAPEALLGVYTQLHQTPPPDAFVLCICGEQFELGEGLSVQAAARLAAVQAFGRQLLLAPEVSAWNNLCTNAMAPAMNLRTTYV